MIEGESIETEEPLDRADILRIHRLPICALCRVRAPDSPFIPYQTADLFDPPSRETPATDAPERSTTTTQFVTIFEGRFFTA